MFVPQPLQRTVLPRASGGTARIRRHVSFGHMIRMASADTKALPSKVLNPSIVRYAPLLHTSPSPLRRPRAQTGIKALP